MRARFRRMLAEETETARDAGVRPQVASRARSILPWAAVLIVGIAVGYMAGNRRSDEMAALRDQVQDLRQTVALTLLERGTVSERLEGAAFGRAVPVTEDARFAAALLARLIEDPNVNVRLAAIEALRPLAARADRRDELVSAVTRQESPLVAISLIDVLLESDGVAARKQLERLAADPALDPAIRGYLRDRLGRTA
jgi:hypothetical protein